jgi:prepilin-type N-terminal cleavage/methylation domain-containing protein
MDDRSAKRPGFTMVEMLTVIAVIAILAAILFPVFAQARKKVHQTRCISNMHQVSQALTLYHDANNRYPLALDSFQVGAVRFRPMAAQARDESMFRCPLNVYANADAGLPGAFSAAQLTTAAQTVKRFPVPGGPINLCVDARGGPKGLRVNCAGVGSSAGPALFPRRDSYDGGFVPNQANATWEQHYSRDWTEQPASISDFQRQLKFRTPPANTVVTWCMNHLDSIDGAGVPHGPVPVLFLDGHHQLKRGEQMYQWGQPNNTWQVLP